AARRSGDQNRKDEEAPHAAAETGRPGRLFSSDRLGTIGGLLVFRGDDRRQREEERRATPFLAFDPDRSAVPLHDLLRDVEAEAEAAVVRRGDLAAAMESLEYLREFVAR